MSLSGAAGALGLPEALVQRSAEARSAETGQSVEEILAAWAGGEAAAAPAQEVAETSGDGGPSEELAAEDEDVEDSASEQQEPPPKPTITAAPGPAGPKTPPTRAPVPAEVTPAEAAHLPEVITVPTAGIKERTNFVIPKWLTGLLLVAPLFALFALGGSATGACGEATELTTDVITGEIVNCDGSEFTGGGVGGGDANFIALGGDLYAGNVTSASNCSGCHQPDGAGTAQFPSLTGVLTTFGACADHIEWVRLGSAGFTTYGDTNKRAEGGMPAHQSLTEEQLASVVAFERVRFGGADPDQTLVDCGLVEGDGGEAPTGSTLPGDDGTSTTLPADADAEASARLAGS